MAPFFAQYSGFSFPGERILISADDMAIILLKSSTTTGIEYTQIHETRGLSGVKYAYICTSAKAGINLADKTPAFGLLTTSSPTPSIKQFSLALAQSSVAFR